MELFVGSFAVFMLFMFALGLLFLAFWIWMIVDCAQRKFKQDNEKIIWIIVIVLAGIIGAGIYYFVVKVNDKK